MGKLYTIKYGDVLSQIALDNNTSEDDIMKHNPKIINRHEIEAEDVIVLPTKEWTNYPYPHYEIDWPPPAGSTSSPINTGTAAVEAAMAINVAALISIANAISPCSSNITKQETHNKCSGILIRSIDKNYKITINNDQPETRTYQVSKINNGPISLELNGCVNWKFTHVNQQKSESFLNSDIKFDYQFSSDLNGDLYKIYAYIKSPTENVSAYTWINKSYDRLLKKALDNNITTISGIFRHMCEFFLLRYNDYEKFDNWNSRDNAKEMLTAISDFLLEDAEKLSLDDLDRRQKIVNHYDAGGYKSSKTNEFNGQWDKMKHFFMGQKITGVFGNTSASGYWAGFLAEKIDSIKKFYGKITGTHNPHQVGFDWKDFAWTAAGSLFRELLVDTPSDTKRINLFHAICNDKFNFSNIFNDISIPAGHSYFNLPFSPGVQTTIDKVDDELKKMKENIERHYENSN